MCRGPKAYSTVQVGPGQEDHIELNSSLLYTNHSCRPNVAFQVLTPGEPTNENDWKVVALREIRKGETLSFFYPSTEWEMDRPFDCRCGEKVRSEVLFSPGREETMLTTLILALICRSACERSRAHEISLGQTSRPNGGSARTSGNSRTRRSSEVSLSKEVEFTFCSPPYYLCIELSREFFC